MKTIDIQQNGLSFQIACDEKNRPRLLYAGLAAHQPDSLPEPADGRALFLLQGEQPAMRSYVAMDGKKHLGLPGYDLELKDWDDAENDAGRKIIFHLAGENLKARLHWQFYGETAALRAWLEVENPGRKAHGIDAIAPVLIHGIFQGPEKEWEEHSHLWIAHNSWCGELRWIGRSLPEHGLTKCREQTTSRVAISNTGSWSTKEYLPSGVYEDRASGTALAWQVESHGSWGWEIGDSFSNLYLCAGLLTECDHAFYHDLRAEETLESLPVSLVWAEGGFDEAMGELTRYRRAMRRPSWDNDKLPVIFNDYMNCLFADPTTEKELPLIAAAAEVGAEIYCIDAGWYADREGGWWSRVGEWKPSPDRFEGGIQQMLGEILEAGMIPGLWLELEVMGIECKLARRWPDECFFMRHGKRLNLRGRYQLDFRHPIVREHADKTIDRLVRWGTGYIKMDYNIDTGIGTDVNADSPGDGLLQHSRAYLDWLDGVFERHPHLIIENCGSGGLRMDYALLSRHSIQSSSDQEDYRLYGRISCLTPTGATPEQQAVWSYPKRDGDEEETIFNMVNAMIGRIHQSGHLAELSPQRRALVKEAIDVYKEIRADLKIALPFWPLGVPDTAARQFALALRSPQRLALGVWKLNEEGATLEIPVTETLRNPEMVYPGACREQVYLEESMIKIEMPEGPAARFVVFTLEQE